MKSSSAFPHLVEQVVIARESEDQTLPIPKLPQTVVGVRADLSQLHRRPKHTRNIQAEPDFKRPPAGGGAVQVDPRILKNFPGRKSLYAGYTGCDIDVDILHRVATKSRKMRRLE